MPTTYSFRRCLKQALMGSVASAILLAAAPSFAQSQSQMDRLGQQIRDLQQQLDSMKSQVTDTQSQVQQVQKDTVDLPKVQLVGGHPGFVSKDGQNSLLFTGRLHFDMGDYLTVSGSKHSLQSGVNARRARLGVLGTVGGVWGYSFIGDFGGSNDAGGALIEDAHISYLGFKPAIIDLGYTDIPWTLGEATSSNDLMFLERSSAQAFATAFGGGDARSTLGIHSNGSNWWGGFYLTGPAVGQSHTGGNSGQSAELARLTFNPYQGPDNTTIHLGVNGAYMNRASNTKTFAFSDRPELRIDTATFLNTGTLTVDSGSVIGAEAAATYDNFYVDGEYFHYNINRPSGASDLGFDGGYVQASYTFGGRRSYSPGAGAYSGVKPDHPLDLSFNGWGAWELAARYSSLDLNDGTVAGGKQNTYSAGINWYPNTTIKFMLDYIHADVRDAVSPAANLSMDAVAARAQFAF